MTTISKRTGIIGAGVLAAVTATALFLSSSDIIDVPVGANLQAAIDAAPAGATLRLAETGVYSCNCTVNKPLRIESVGQRTVGAAFGKTFTVGAKVVSPNAGPALYVAPRTDGAFVTGIEITHAGFIYDIVKVGAQGPEQDTVEEAPRNITFDRVWIHGTFTDHIQNGLVANGVNVTVTNSRIDEIHGVGVESHGIIVYNGPGPFNFSDNFIAAAGINILFGGAVPAIPGTIPTGIRAERNHLYKPLTWKVGHATYAGVHWGVKNLLELKMGKDAVIDSNLLENSWADAQIGYAVLFTVRGENGKAPWATIESVTFSNNVVKNADQGFQLLGQDDGGGSQRATGLRVIKNLFDNITGRFITMSGYYNATFEHNTHTQGGNIMSLYNEPSTGFVYRNNVTVRNPNGFGIFGDGSGEGNPAIAAYLPGGVIEGNVIAGATARNYPANNHYPADLSGLGSLRGTDGLVPGYSTTAAPLPSQSPIASPTVSANPSPSVAPTAPPATAPSANNTRVPPASAITDSEGAKWTLDGVRMLRNEQSTGGFGPELLWCNGRMYGKGEDLKYWTWTNPGWAQVGTDPCASATPTPTATATPQPVPTATATPAPTVTPVPTVTPTPIRFCRTGERPGNPPRCVCRNGPALRNGKCP
jgi:hypothetical protein